MKPNVPDQQTASFNEETARERKKCKFPIKSLKSIFTSSAIRDMETKTALTFHITPGWNSNHQERGQIK